MKSIVARICELYDEGKTVQQIRNRFKYKRIYTQDIVDILQAHHTELIYNVMLNKYDMIVMPSKINYNTRVFKDDKHSKRQRFQNN